MNASISNSFVFTPPSQHLFPVEQLIADEKDNPKRWVSAFGVAERRFGETFDTSTHAAVIKMMMATLGPTPANMFNQVVPCDNGYAVTMKDEFQVYISQGELHQIAQASRFNGDDTEVVRAANFALAVFVKRKQSVGGYDSFEAALATTLEGETTFRCLKGMGVYGLCQYVSPSEMVGQGVVAVMGVRNKGSALVVDGVGQDHGQTLQIGKNYGFRMFAGPPRPSPLIDKAPASNKPEDIWRGFYQGAEGNCVTVSAIKAAMMRFGQSPRDIYRQVTEVEGGFEVIMRDSFRLTLTHDELGKARIASNFVGNDTALVEDANFLYAVSAIRAQLENNDFRARKSFDVAMETLNDGEMPGEALRRLGLIAYIRQSDIDELAQGAIGTLADNNHSVVVVNGAIDWYGEKQTLRSSPGKGLGLWALKLV
ncbi:hypothetical protein DYL61_06930 [Pseudomonas nabeulensis]|uniref:Uncharacterized protein n=1 Tax=Pseudomonas nabeulensis TaxID=2293833 RepID=A0A4Z0B9A7_9PSED|nr:hypothetical protein [Pseudomonas nabeulensis]TFY94904.1 hypothetical protein DYL61_06930 [Pseudomonas nabeulensis]